MMIVRPDLLHPERAAAESGADQHRLDLPPGVYTGIWWYARFPEHYAGDGTAATRELGEYQVQWSGRLHRQGHRSHQGRRHQPQAPNRVLPESTHPLDTPQ